MNQDEINRRKIARAYTKRAQEIASIVNVGNGARLKVVNRGNYGVNLQIVNARSSPNNTNYRAHMLVIFDTDANGPHVNLASGRTREGYKKPQPGESGYNYGYGSIIRALAVQIAQDVGARVTQTSVNVNSMLNQPGVMPISGRIMKNIGAKMTGKWQYGSGPMGAHFEVGRRAPTRVRTVLRKKKIVIPNLPPQYSNQLSKLEKGLRMLYNGARLSYNSTLMNLPRLHQTMNTVLNAANLSQLKTKINVMKRRIPNKTRLYSMKNLVNYYTATLKRSENARAAAVAVLKKRLEKKIAKPRARSKYISPAAAAAVRLQFNLSNIPKNASAANVIRIAKTRNIPSVIIELELKKRGLPVNMASLYTPQELANRAKFNNKNKSKSNMNRN
jgi:hypothetical protein